MYDSRKILFTHLIGSAGLLYITVIARHIDSLTYLMIPFSVIIVHFFISVSLLTGSRLFIKFVYYQLSTPSKQLQNILLFGAGDMGLITRLVIEQDDLLKYNIVGLIDDNIQMQSKQIGGLPVWFHLL